MKKTLSSMADVQGALIRSVSELLAFDGQEFYNWQASKLGNDLFINDPERASRIHNAAEYGADGSTHAEHIEDFREYGQEHYDKLTDAVEFGLAIDSENEAEIAAFEAACKAMEVEVETAREALEADLDRLEKWHEDNGSLYEEVG